MSSLEWEEFRTLRRLFLIVTIRGPVAHWRTRQEAPQSQWRLGANGLFYALWGLTAFYFIRRPLGSLIFYLHATSWVLVGLYLANMSADFLGEETSALSFRPISQRSVIWAKGSVMAQMAVWLAGTLNLTGCLVGTYDADGRSTFAAVHAFSAAIESLFCLGCALLLPAALRRWRALSGGMRLVAAVLLIAACALPPVCFAGLDEALLGGAWRSWLLGLFGVASTLAVLGMGLFHLPTEPTEEDGAKKDPKEAEQTLKQPRLRLSAQVLRWLLRSGNLWWGQRSPAADASFLVAALYIVRSRDTRFRLLSCLSVFLVVPPAMLLPHQGAGIFGPWSVALTGCFLPLAAYLSVYFVEVSVDWRAAAVFHTAPLVGPGELCAGGRRAVQLLCLPPMVLLYGAGVWLLKHDAASLLLLLPGVLAAPFFTYLPGLSGRGVPCSAPPDGGDSPQMNHVLWYVCPVFAGLAASCRGTGYFWLVLAVEAFTLVHACRVRGAELRLKVPGTKTATPSN